MSPGESSSELRAIPSCLQHQPSRRATGSYGWARSTDWPSSIQAPVASRGSSISARPLRNQIALGNGTVWASLDTSYAKAVDARSRHTTAKFYAGTGVFAIALDRSAVWLAGEYGEQLWKLVPSTGATIRTGSAGKGATGIALGFGGVWIASWPEDTLVRVDPATGNVLATIPIVGEPEDIAVGDGLVWVAVQRPPSEG